MHCHYAIVVPVSPYIEASFIFVYFTNNNKKTYVSIRILIMVGIFKNNKDQTF